MFEPIHLAADAAVRHRIREPMLSRFPLARQHPRGSDDSLLDLGLVDSLGILEPVEFIGESSRVTVSDDGIDPDDFASITGLASSSGGIPVEGGRAI